MEHISKKKISWNHFSVEWEQFSHKLSSTVQLINIVVDGVIVRITENPFNPMHSGFKCRQHVKIVNLSQKILKSNFSLSYLDSAWRMHSNDYKPTYICNVLQQKVTYGPCYKLLLRYKYLHQNWSASALFCLNSRAQSKYAVVNLIHTRRKQTFLSFIMW